MLSTSASSSKRATSTSQQLPSGQCDRNCWLSCCRHRHSSSKRATSTSQQLPSGQCDRNCWLSCCRCIGIQQQTRNLHIAADAIRAMSPYLSAKLLSTSASSSKRATSTSQQMPSGQCHRTCQLSCCRHRHRAANAQSAHGRPQMPTSSHCEFWSDGWLPAQGETNVRNKHSRVKGGENWHCSHGLFFAFSQSPVFCNSFTPHFTSLDTFVL